MFRVLICILLLAIPASAKQYQSSAWTDDACNYYNGSNWVNCTKYYYDGAGAGWTEIESTSAEPVIDTNSDNLPNGGTSIGSVSLSGGGGSRGGYMQIAAENDGKYIYAIDIELWSVDGTGTMTCRFDDDANMDAEYIATGEVEVDSGDGTYQVIWNDSTTALSDAAVYWWACQDTDTALDANITYSNDVADSGYDYGSGDWNLDHTDDPTRDLEVQFYVH